MRNSATPLSLIGAAVAAAFVVAACSPNTGDAKSGDAGAKSSAKMGTIAAGTEIAVRPSAKICTNTQKPGEHVAAIVADAVSGSGGAAIPAGANATLEVVESQYGQNGSDKVRLSVRVASVTFGGETYDVGADVAGAPVTNVRRQSTGAQAGKVATGAAAGAVVGKVAGKSAGATVAGAVVGAAAGAVVAKETADYDGCIAADARLMAKFARDVSVRAGG